jgi:hypothetical protein
MIYINRMKSKTKNHNRKYLKNQNLLKKIIELKTIFADMLINTRCVHNHGTLINRQPPTT